MLNISPLKQALIWLTCAVGLLLAMPNGFYSRVEAHNDAIAAGQQDTTWPSFLPSGLVNLGLDLRGGAQLLAEVQVEDVYTSIMNEMWNDVRTTLVAERDVVGFVTREDGPDDILRVRISEAAGADRALTLVRGLAQPVASLAGAGQNLSLIHI